MKPIVVFVVAVAVLAAGTVALENVIALSTAGTITINQPISFLWTAERNVTYNDQIWIMPHNVTEYVDCLTQWSTCVTQYYDSGVWGGSLWTLNEDGGEYDAGSVSIQWPPTSYPSDWDAWLVLCDDPWVTFTDSCSAVSVATFAVTSTNTLTLLSATPLHYGAVFSYTAPQYHGGNDYVKLIDASCTPTVDNDYCVLTYDMVPYAPSGNIAFEIPSYFTGDVYAVYDVVDKFRTAVSSTYTVTDTYGKCGPTCDNAGVSCADDTECFNCDPDFCTWLSYPSLYERTTLNTAAERIMLSGDTSIIMELVAETSGDPSALKFYLLGDPQYGELIEITASPLAANYSNVIFNLTLTSPLEVGWYEYEFYAVNEHGMKSSTFEFWVDYREQWCGAWGDPHFTSFDGITFDFQGNGDFDFVRACGTAGQMPAEFYTFGLQGRFSPCWGSEEVTCTSGASAVICGGSTTLAYVSNYSVALGADVWYVMLGKQTLTVSETPMNITCPNDGSIAGTISRNADNIVVVDLRKRVGIKFVVEPNGPNLEVLATSQWIGHTCGLCGLFNGDPSDDLRTPTGTTLNTETATMEQIYTQFGMEWHVAGGEESFFNNTYEVLGTSWTSTNFNITPTFTPQFDTTDEEAEATLMCGNIPGALPNEVTSCIFDCAAGGLPRAMSTLAMVMARCNMETDGSMCSPPQGCGEWCGLHGQCVESTTAAGTYSCQCSPGYEPPLCTAATHSASSHPGTHSNNAGLVSDSIDAATSASVIGATAALSIAFVVAF